MIALPNTTTRRALGFNMTPMIDVVFLLIIFFLVSSHLAQSDAQLPLPLPAASSGELADPEIERAVVNVKPNGEYLLAGRVIEPQRLAEVMRAIVRERKEKMSRFGSAPPKRWPTAPSVQSSRRLRRLGFGT